MYDASVQSAKHIYHCLDISPFETCVGEWTFKFSTERHLDKFKDELEKHTLWLNDSIGRRFHVIFDCGILAAISLYQRIEGRGFYMVNTVTGETFRNAREIVVEVVI